ncbi:MAG: LysR family transcriptional regulator [Bacteroidales bacterium]|nr:LysR family transcriptional regulator [Candidatus Liminaster caballi]
MTFQQLEYIVAVDKSRHFVNAATACGVTQSTLSTTISKLEQEIDVLIFDRSKHPIEPTPMGKRIIEQAEIILHNSAQLREMVQSEREDERGKLLIGMMPSVAPVLVPQFCNIVGQASSGIEVHIFEKEAPSLIERLQRAEIDIAIVDSTDITDTNLLSLDLYTERFMLYASSASHLTNRGSIRVEDLLDGSVWTLRSFHDRYPQLTEVTHQSTLHHVFIDAGSLSTLISAVDANGGFTLLPESYASCLSPEQRERMYKINSGKFFRTVSIAIRRDYVRERMLNVVVNAIRRIIPHDMLDMRITKFDKVKI